ncbi:hypothetical protein ACIRU8_10325 [Streptomyces sp. NPDC101175]|uniref:hypothetical protein n=1 Tax=Streptomyces sp. NPDC101175 TaxID=3366123 RepID=UPI003836CD49
MSTKEQFIQLAWNAVSKAGELAAAAERHARSNDQQRTEPLATAGRLWADVAHTYTAIAAVLPEPLPELPGGTEY